MLSPTNSKEIELYRQFPVDFDLKKPLVRIKKEFTYSKYISGKHFYLLIQNKSPYPVGLGIGWIFKFIESW